MTHPTDSIDRMLALLELERKTEVEETGRLLDRLSGAQLEARGLAIQRLRVTEESSGLGGRIVLALERSTGESLPPGRIQPGDIVRLVAQDPSGSSRGRAEELRQVTGVVWKRAGHSLQVAFDELPDDGAPDGLLRLERVANDVSYRRMRESLERVRAADRGRLARLREILLGDKEPSFGVPEARVLAAPGAAFLALDPSQREAVRFALGARDIALIHGPPGTGKTTTVAALLAEAVRGRERVLATAPSNVAVDNLAEKLSASGLRVVRLGHPARLLPGVVELSLDARVAEHPHTKAAMELRRTLERTLKRLRRERDWAARRALKDELTGLRREIRAAEKDAVEAVLDEAEVILATCTGAADPVLADREFALVVVDEAAQALEPASWIPIEKGARVVLAGDHRQLPPTIISLEAARGGLGSTLFDRCMARWGEGASRLLSTQYRMHRAIMEYPSRRLYEGRLEAHPSVEGHLLRDLAGVEDADETATPLVFIDTAGCGYEEETESDGESKENPGEVEAVARVVAQLVALGLEPHDIAVIAPYSAQVRRLRDRLAAHGSELECDTVDGFQGREKEAVVISLVRSNDRGEVGFLSDVRRLNVAITRARRRLTVIGDSATVSRDPFIAGFVAYAEDLGAYRSEWEFR